MPLEVNAQFNQFVQFAQDQANPATSKAIARMGVEGPLGGRAIKASERREGDSVRPFLPRSTANKNANDAVRNLFRQSIASMFGGENRIPLALDPHGRDNQLTVAGDPSPEFTICFAEDGSLKVDCKLVASDNDAVTCRTGYKITVA